MGWREDNPTEGPDVNRFLRIPNPEKKGETVRVTLRVLDAEPEGTWRHWFGRRPYNCPGQCPVCAVRKIASEVDKEAAKKKYQMEYVYFFNVLVDGEVKIYSFKNAVARKLREFIHEYGDLRNYDVVIVKHKNGPLDVNIEWDVMYKGERPLTDVEQELASEKYDLLSETKPATREDLEKVSKEEVPEVKTDISNNATSNVKVQEYSTAIDVDTVLGKFAAIVKEKGKELADYGVDPQSPPSDRVLKAMIAELQD